MLLKMMYAIVACHVLFMVLVSAASSKNTADVYSYEDEDDVAEYAQLRFLTGTGTVNQLIDRGQDALEQLRPTNGNANIRPIHISLSNNGNGGGNVGNGGALGPIAAQGTPPIVGLLPQIVGQGAAGGTATSPTNPTNPTSPTNPSSPAVAPGRRRVSNKRRRVVRVTNKRRRVNGGSSNRRRVNGGSSNRRRRRRPTNGNSGRPQIVVFRPQRG